MYNSFLSITYDGQRSLALELATNKGLERIILSPSLRLRTSDYFPSE